MIEVVAALIWQQDKFMICQRPTTKARALLWEFVGGKVEKGESQQAALIRECQEELAITVKPLTKYLEVNHHYTDIDIHLTVYQAQIVKGVPKLLEHQDLKWITVQDIDNYNFCPADEEILNKLKQENKGTI